MKRIFLCLVQLDYSLLRRDGPDGDRRFSAPRIKFTNSQKCSKQARPVPSSTWQSATKVVPFLSRLIWIT
jgi:hypothetical protein